MGGTFGSKNFSVHLWKQIKLLTQICFAAPSGRTFVKGNMHFAMTKCCCSNCWIVAAAISDIPARPTCQKWHPKKCHCHSLDYGQAVQLQLNVWNCFHQSGLFIVEVICVTWQRLNPIHWSWYADNTWMAEDRTVCIHAHTGNCWTCKLLTNVGWVCVAVEDDN